MFVDLEADLSSHGPPEEGRHPLPGLRELQAAARGWGLNDGDRVVVYDGGSGLGAARAWWTLRWGGVQDVRILDGGLPAWQGELETGEVITAPGDIVLTGGGMPTLGADEAAALARDGVLLDARAPERFRGEIEPYDRVPGHIPGARNAPATGNLGADGRYLPPAQLRARYEALGVRDGVEVGAYCGSGISAVPGHRRAAARRVRRRAVPRLVVGVGVGPRPPRRDRRVATRRGPMSSVASAAARTLSSPGSAAFSRFLA